MTNLSPTQIKEICASVLGAAAKVPGTLISMGILFIVLGVIGIAGQTLFSFVTINVLGAFLVLYVAAGIYTWVFPIPALEAITLWLAAIFFVTGILRLISAFQHRHFREWFWLVLSSAISILMGVLIMNGYPEGSLWLPGLLIAIELLLQGWALLFLGLAARSLTKSW